MENRSSFKKYSLFFGAVAFGFGVWLFSTSKKRCGKMSVRKAFQKAFENQYALAEKENAIVPLSTKINFYESDGFKVKKVFLL